MQRGSHAPDHLGVVRAAGRSRRASANVRKRTQHGLGVNLGGTGISSVELDYFRKLFLQPTSKFPGKFPGNFSISRPKEALITLIEGLGTETKIEKVDIFLPEANLENGPSDLGHAC